MSNSNILHIITQLGYDLYSTNKLRILSSHETEILIQIIWSEECFINQICNFINHTAKYFLYVLRW